MTDQAIETSFNEMGELEELSRGSSSSIFITSTGNAIVGLLFCLALLGSMFYMSHNYRVGERREMQEAERNRIEAEKEELENRETYRSKMAKILESYAIHLTNMTSRASSSVVGHNKNHPKSVTRQIPTGDEGDDINKIPIETITIKSCDSSTDIEDGEESSVICVDENDDDNDAPTLAQAPSTLTIDTSIHNQTQECCSKIPSSTMSVATTVTQANLREAVTDNPCAICLEPFRPGDDIVVCSNSIFGRKPHIFHQECSLDYIVNHTDGINAPCPCCQNLLLPSEEQRKGCLKHSHQSALTLPELGRDGDGSVVNTPSSTALDC